MPRPRRTVVAALVLACSAGPVRAQPANDDCATAAPITRLPLSVTCDTDAAASEPSAPPLPCHFFGPGTNSVWWYTAPADVQLLVL